MRRLRRFPGCAPRDDIDAVVIALGDRWHSVATVMAAEAGKDIYVENRSR